VGGGPFGQSFSFFLLGMVGEGLGDLRVRGRTSGERSGFFCNGLFTLIFIQLHNNVPSRLKPVAFFTFSKAIKRSGVDVTELKRNAFFTPFSA